MRHVLIISGLCEFSLANLKICSQSQDKLSKKEVFDESPVCLTDENRYSAPFPISLTLDLYFKNFIRIDEDLNSITIQVELWAYWTDPGLALTNDQG